MNAADGKRVAERSGWAGGADALAWGSLALGAAVRVGLAWATRAVSEPDPSVVGLMARHMAEFREFPVFFYGQAYMGSLEPMASALMMLGLGPTGWALNLGPVLFSVAALFFLWRWARDAAGPWGGLGALWAGLFGPLAYFQFQAAARGGYMVALFVDALVLFAAARMAARLRGGQSVSVVRWLGLGFLAGLGLWSNMIVVPALAAAALLLAHGLRWRLWRHPGALTAGLAGLAAGLSPWLAWNLRHGGGSLRMSQIGGHAPPVEALANAWDRFLMLQEARHAVPGSQGPLLLAAALLALAALGAGVAHARRRSAAPGENYARAGAVVFCAVFALVFVTSGFTRTHTARYWIPLVPGLAVLAGVGCAVPGRRGLRVVAGLLLAAVVGRQGWLAVAGMGDAARKNKETLAAFRETGEALERIGADALLAPLQLYPLNFALAERVAVSNGRQSFYEPILRRVEESAAPAYASDFNGIGPFLEQHGARWESLPAAGRAIVWNVRRRAVPLREIPPEESGGLRDGAGRDLRPVLLDRNLDTAWPAEADPAARLEWTFAAPREIQAIQLVFAHSMADESFDFPRRLRIEAETAEGWSVVLDDAPVIPLEWSGPRLFVPSGFARPEYRIGLSGVMALRVTFVSAPAPGRLPWRLAEVLGMEGRRGEDRRYDEETVAELSGWLQREAPQSVVFAPRWISNRLLSTGAVAEDRLAGLSARVYTGGNLARDGSIPADRPCVFVVESGHAETARRTFAAHGMEVRLSTVGSWAVFRTDPGDWNADGLGLPPAAAWNGDTLLAGRARARADEALRRLGQDGVPEETLRALLAEVARWRPAALSALTEDEVRRLGGEAAVSLREGSAHVPPVPCATAFGNGARLEGMAAGPVAVRAGGMAEVRLYWTASAAFEPGLETVFVHLRDARGKIVAQEDYRGPARLWGDASLRVVPGEIVEDVRRIALPAGLPPGPLDVAVGLYHSGKGRRVPIRHSEAPGVRRRSAVWPAALRVEP